MKYWKLLLAATLALPLALPVHASEIYWDGAALETSPANSCVRTPLVGTNHTYTTMACSTAVAQSFVAHGYVPPDATANTYSIVVYWTSESAATDDVCWTITTGVCIAPLPSCNYNTMTLGNSVATIATGNSGAGIMRASTIAANATLFNTNGGSNCTGGFCAEDPLVVRVARDNTCGGNNLNATVDVTAVKIIFQ